VTFADAIAAILSAQAVAPEVAHRLASYGQLVLDVNRTTNLTAARDAAAFAEHILDALTLAGDIDGPLIDLGSGAGLPVSRSFSLIRLGRRRRSSPERSRNSALRAKRSPLARSGSARIPPSENDFGAPRRARFRARLRWRNWRCHS
jgi:hypothetical protein